MQGKALVAEFIGTFTVVAAISAASMLAVPAGGGPFAVALAAGLSVCSMGFAVGHISGGHFNPAVTLGLIAGGRFETGNAIGYIVAQVLGGIVAAFAVQALLAGALGAGPGATTRWSDLAGIANSYGGARGFSMVAAFLVEAVATAVLVVVVIGATSPRAAPGVAPLAVGVVVIVLYLVVIPVTNGSINPARSTGPAVLVGGAPLSQLWLFWAAPTLGAVVGGAVGRWLDEA